MAIYNEILTPRYARMLQKLFGVKGTVPTKQLSGEISVAFPLFNGNENRILEGWDRYGAESSNAATVTQNGLYRLFNPPNSNVIAVVEKITIATVVATSFLLQHGQATTSLATVFNATDQRFDARTKTKQGVAVFSNTTNNGLPSIGASKGICALGASNSYDFIQQENQEITVLPGDAIQIFNNTQNQADFCAMWWRERVLEDSEQKT